MEVRDAAREAARRGTRRAFSGTGSRRSAHHGDERRISAGKALERAAALYSDPQSRRGRTGGASSGSIGAPTAKSGRARPPTLATPGSAPSGLRSGASAARIGTPGAAGLLSALESSGDYVAFLAAHKYRLGQAARNGRAKDEDTWDTTQARRSVGTLPRGSDKDGHSGRTGSFHTKLVPPSVSGSSTNVAARALGFPVSYYVDPVDSRSRPPQRPQRGVGEDEFDTEEDAEEVARAPRSGKGLSRAGAEMMRSPRSRSSRSPRLRRIGSGRSARDASSREDQAAGPRRPPRPDSRHSSRSAAGPSSVALAAPSSTATKKSKPRRPKVVKVYLKGARSGAEAVRLAIAQLGPKFVESESERSAHLFFFAKVREAEDIIARLKPNQSVSRFPGSARCARKRSLAMALGRLQQLFPSAYDFSPRTFCLPDEMVEMTEYIESKRRKTFIYKPDEGSQGEGIFLFRQMSAMRKHLGRLAVVQEYIARPLLIDGIKFDFRVYVLLRSAAPLEVFLCREGLARFATQKYKKPTKYNLQKQFMHLTNYSINKNSESYVHAGDASSGEDDLFDGEETESDEELGSIGAGGVSIRTSRTRESRKLTTEASADDACEDSATKRTLSSVLRQLSRAGKDIHEVWRRIQVVVARTLVAMQPELAHAADLRARSSVVPSRKGSSERLMPPAFHIFGLDIMLDQKLKPWLLEVNNSPSLRVDFERDEGDGYYTLEPSPVDERVKADVLAGAMEIVVSGDTSGTLYDRVVPHARPPPEKKNSRGGGDAPVHPSDTPYFHLFEKRAELLPSGGRSVESVTAASSKVRARLAASVAAGRSSGDDTELDSDEVTQAVASAASAAAEAAGVDLSEVTGSAAALGGSGASGSGGEAMDGKRDEGDGEAIAATLHASRRHSDAYTPFKEGEIQGDTLDSIDPADTDVSRLLVFDTCRLIFEALTRVDSLSASQFSRFARRCSASISEAVGCRPLGSAEIDLLFIQTTKHPEQPSLRVPMGLWQFTSALTMLSRKWFSRVPPAEAMTTLLQHIRENRLARP